VSTEPLALAKPRAPRRPTPRRSNFELYSWLFMRISGLALIILVLGHLLIMNILDGGVHRINFAFVAGRWASPFWQFWDLSMLWLAEIHGATGRKVSIVGWSLGGVYARDLALQAPDMVRYVVTLGSPFANDVRATNATRLYEALSGEAVEDNPELRAAISGDLPVPTTSIYSRADGIVNWRTCLLRPSDTAENIEVHLASHIGLGVNAAALWAVADRLAQTEGEFKQFDRSGPFAIAYAPPETAQS